MALTPEEKKARELELDKILKELERMSEEEKFRFYHPTPKQIELQLSPKRSRFILAGNRVGKTVAGAIIVTIIALGKRALPYMLDWPESFLEEYKKLAKKAPTEELRQKYAEMATEEYVAGLVARYVKMAEDAPPKARIWVCSDTYETQRDVVQKELVGDPDTLIGGWIPRNEIKGKPTYRDSKVIDLLRLKSGAVIGFKSYDQGRKKFQGTSQHLCWQDEESPEDVRSEIRMRLMDVRGIEVGTMTPLSGLSHIYDNVYLNESKPPGKKDPEILCLEAGWDDNPYLSTEEKERLEATMDPNELEARKYGRFIMPGKCVFDSKKVSEGLKRSYPGERGDLVWTDNEGVEWVESDDGEYEIWFHPDPQNEYIIPADVAEGLEHGDFDAVGVLNRTKNIRLDAVYHGKIDADELADYIHRLAVYYGGPLTAPEVNNHGLTTISHLKKVYYNIYKSQVYDKQHDETRDKLGWITSPKTRPLLVDSIKKAVREEMFECYWRRFWDEAMNFIRHPSGKEAARSGYWDDTVMMAGIGTRIHSAMPMGEGYDSFMPGSSPSKRRGGDFDRYDDDDDDVPRGGGFYSM